MFKKSRRKIIASIMTILLLLFLGTLGIIYGSSYYEVYTRNHEMLVNYMNIYLLEVTPAEGAPEEDTTEEGSQGNLTDRSASFAAPPDIPEQDADPGQGPAAPQADEEGAGTPPDIPAGDPPREPDSIQDHPEQDEAPDAPPQGDPGRRSEEDRRVAAYQLSTFYSVALSPDGEVLRIDNEEDSGGYSDDELTTIAQELVSGGRTSGMKWNLVYLIEDKGEYTLAAFMNNTILQESMTTLVRYTLLFGSIAILLFFFLSIYLAHRIVAPLEESYTRQRQFISDAGHELKTPVAVITANMEILEKEIGPSKWLSNIHYETDRMSGLVTQLLELARTENVRLVTENLDYSRLVYGEILPFESVAFESGIVMDYEIADEIHVCGNSAQLRQLTGILMDNAIRHVTGDHKVHIALVRERGQAVLSVSNTGEEILEEQRAQLFERFYRADEAHTDSANHYGLGLAIAKAIVTAHKGRIGVDCRNGQVVFTVRLPLAKSSS